MKTILITLSLVLPISCLMATQEYFYQISGLTENCGCKSQNGYYPVCISSPVKKLEANNDKQATEKFKTKICKDAQGLIIEDCSCTKPKDDIKVYGDELRKCRTNKAILVKVEKIKGIKNLIGMEECKRAE